MSSTPTDADHHGPGPAPDPAHLDDLPPATLVARGLTLRGGRGPVFGPLDLVLPPQTHLAVLGTQGSGRSALLLGKAKDNNASCALGPIIRLFDETFDLDQVRQCVVTLEVQGEDGFRLQGSSSMAHPLLFQNRFGPPVWHRQRGQVSRSQGPRGAAPDQSCGSATGAALSRASSSRTAACLSSG